MTATGVRSLRLATRGSALARAQASIAGAAVVRAGAASTEMVVVSTLGDREKEARIDELGGQGWFTAEVDRAVLDGRADIAVHSAKDLPTASTVGLVLAAVLERGDARDAVVTRDGAGLGSLAPGTRVGSSSARRAALLADLRPDLVCVPVRGNVDTRLGKLESGEIGALLVAAAGLDRLGLGDRGERLDPRRFVPAPAQGAIALVALTGSAAAALAGSAGDPQTRTAVLAERAVLRAAGGGCLLPLGAWARFEDGRLVLTAALGGSGGVRRAEASGDPGRPEELGERVAASLR